MVSPIVPTPIAPVEVYTVKTRGEVALSEKELLKNKGFFDRLFAGSAQKLASASKKLLKDPTNEVATRAFYAQFQARCTKLGIDSTKLAPGEERQLLEQVLAENGKEVTNLSDVQKSVVEKIVTIAKNAFADTLSDVNNKLTDSMAVADIQSAIEEKAEKFAAFVGNGATAEKFETELKSAVFAKLEKKLKEQAEFKGDVAKRIEAEVKKSGDMRKEYRNFRSSELSSQLSHHNLVVDAMNSKIVKSTELLESSVLMLNKDLSGLQKALTTLVETGKSKGVNCESQEKLLKLVTSLTQNLVSERSVESMKEVGDQLPALLKFLNAGDSKVFSDPVTTKLPVFDTVAKALKYFEVDGKVFSGPVTKNRPAVKAAVSALQKSLAQFTSANQDLATAKSDLEQLIANTDAVEATEQKLEAELNDQNTLLLDQAALEAYETAMTAHKAEVAGRGIFKRLFTEAPEAPEAPETTTGGVVAIVEKQSAEFRAPAQALYDYLKPVEVVAKKSLLNRMTLGYIG